MLKAMNIQSDNVADGPNIAVLSKGDKTTINLSDVYWNELIRYINQKRCIPFIGPGAPSFLNDNGKSWIPQGRQIAREMIQNNKKLFEDSDLAQEWLEDEKEESLLIDYRIPISESSYNFWR